MSVSTDTSIAQKMHNANQIQHFFLVQLLAVIQRLGTINAKWTQLSNVKWVQLACSGMSFNTFHHQTQHIKPFTD